LILIGPSSGSPGSCLTRRDFASREWFDAACQLAHLRPHVLLESGAPSTLVALAAVGYGIAVVPSNVRIPRAGVRAVPLVQRGAPIGRWLSLAWTPGASWRRTPTTSWTSWSRTPAVRRPSRPPSGARRRCRVRKTLASPGEPELTR